MSTQALETAVAKFLRAETPEVLCIRGAWGVGKSYAWRGLLAKAKDANAIAPTKYAYVTLFGVDSLDQLKYSIFENTIPRDLIGQVATLDTIKSNLGAFAETRTRRLLSTAIQFIPGVRTLSGTAQSLSFLTVRKQLICIDDLERKGKNLRLADVLGLASYLKEERQCKVVLILNDAQLSDGETAELIKYREKVVDHSVEFKPTADDCIRIGLSQETPVRDRLANKIRVLNIRNIRIIKKIESLCLELEAVLRPYHPGVLEETIDSVTLFAWAHLSDKNSLIDFAFDKKGRGLYGTTTKDVTQEERAFDVLLTNYGFRLANEFHVPLRDGIFSGYFDQTMLTEEARKLEEHIKNIELRQAFHDAWELFHNSFDNNEIQLAPALVESVRRGPTHVSPANLHSTFTLLKDMGYLKEATELLEFYIQARDGEPRNFFDINTHLFNSGIYDQQIVDAFGVKYRSFKENLEPIDVIVRIAIENGWSPSDIEVLKPLDVDGWRKLFHELRGADLREVCRLMNVWKGFQDKSEQRIASTAHEALRHIANESPLNRRRVLRYGIELGDIAPDVDETLI